MNNSLILSYTTFVYFGAFMAYLLGMVMNRAFLSRLGTYLSLLGIAAQTLAIILRWVEKSNWLISHVITCFFGYAAFALSFGVSIMYLLKLLDTAEKNNRFLRLIPSAAILDDLNYQMIVIGFLMLTLGIITGAVWAHSAWGTYWSWDPKETWSLITWLVYASVIHTRLVRGWKGKKIAILSIAGFACVLFTYFGVNYLAGLHSYAKQ